MIALLLGSCGQVSGGTRYSWKHSECHLIKTPPHAALFDDGQSVWSGDWFRAALFGNVNGLCANAHFALGKVKYRYQASLRQEKFLLSCFIVVKHKQKMRLTVQRTGCLLLVVAIMCTDSKTATAADGYYYDDFYDYQYDDNFYNDDNWVDDYYNYDDIYNYDDHWEDDLYDYDDNWEDDNYTYDDNYNYDDNWVDDNYEYDDNWVDDNNAPDEYSYYDFNFDDVSSGCMNCLKKAYGECNGHVPSSGSTHGSDVVSPAACTCLWEMQACLNDHCNFPGQERSEAYLQNSIRWVCSEPLYQRTPQIDAPPSDGECRSCLSDFPEVPEENCDKFDGKPSCSCAFYSWADFHYEDFVTRARRLYGCSQTPPEEAMSVQPAQVYLAGLTRADLERMGLAVFIGRFEKDLYQVIWNILREFSSLEVVVAAIDLDDEGVTVEFDVEYPTTQVASNRRLGGSTAMADQIEKPELKKAFLDTHASKLRETGPTSIDSEKSRVQTKKHSPRVETSGDPRDSQGDNTGDDGSGVSPSEKVAIGVPVFVAVGALLAALYYRYRLQQSQTSRNNTANRTVAFQNPLSEATTQCSAESTQPTASTPPAYTPQSKETSVYYV
eukprot:gb/GECG01004987.1/.p1 GENE.gb/GECG01004987.1/~~gb/GECG01004987.1/.p1  ORF type:complete len:609 (+),score=59.20 gb/GECG01004987.1/:1-1827(+)